MVNRIKQRALQLKSFFMAARKLRDCCDSLKHCNVFGSNIFYIVPQCRFLVYKILEAKKFPVESAPARQCLCIHPLQCFRESPLSRNSRTNIKKLFSCDIRYFVQSTISGSIPARGFIRFLLTIVYSSASTCSSVVFSNSLFP